MRRATIFLVLLSVFGLTSKASAAISVSNIASLPSPDGQNITSDSLTGLDWLDPAVTLTQSFNTVTGRFGSDLAGFSYATRLQVITFFSHLPVPLPTSPTYTNTYFNDAGASYDSAIAYFDDTIAFATGGVVATYGLTADPGPGTAQHYYYEAWSNPTTTGTWGTDPPVADALGATYLGSWLIRTTPLAVADVPEPASIIAWSVLGLMITSGGWWHHRKVSA
jgi:hypothetical protein